MATWNEGSEAVLTETRERLKRCLRLIAYVESGQIEREDYGDGEIEWTAWDKSHSKANCFPAIWDAFEAIESEAPNDRKPT